MRRIAPLVLLLAGCFPPSRSSAPHGGELPPAYPRSRITSGPVRTVAEEFTAWARARVVAGQPLYSRIEVQPPTPTVLPYGIGTYQQEVRLPILLTTGPGWDTLPPAERENAAEAAFKEAATRLDGLKLSPPLKPTLTFQTHRGLLLGWINDLRPGRGGLHGGDD